MAGVPDRPDAFFRLVPAEPGKARCFAVRRGDAQARIDAKYFALREKISSLFPLKPLGALMQEEPDYGSGARAVERIRAVEPRYIRITDFGDDGIEPGHEYLTADPIELECELGYEDMLFARSGATVGKTYLHEDTSETAIFAGYCIRFRFRKTEVMPRFAYWCTKTDFYARWVATIQRPAGQPNINKEEFKRFEIPLPKLVIQEKLVSAMDSARASRRAKLAEADGLLAGLDSFLLDALGLALPPKDERRVFAARLCEARTRFDVDFHTPDFRGLRKQIESSKFRAITMETICPRMTTGFAAGRENQSFDDATGIPHIRPLNILPSGEITFEGAKYVPRDYVAPGEIITNGEVLLNNTNSTVWVGKTAVFPNGERMCCCSNHITRLFPDTDICVPEFLAFLLNAIRSTGYLGLLATNFVNQAGINTDTLKTLRLPMPQKQIQKSIVSELTRRREESRRLRSEAQAEWQVAKRWFEEKLLG